MRKKLVFNFSLILFIVLALFTLSSCGDESGSDLNKTTENDSENNDNKESYTVTWYNDDNSVLEKDLNVEEGVMPSYDGETPKKENEEGCSYQFIGWDKEFSKVENNVSYKATFRKVLDICEYKFVDDNDKVISYGSVCYGEEVERPDSAKASDFKYSYEFLGWYVNDELVSDFHIKEDTIFKAKYSKTINKYNIKFVNYDDSVIYEFNMEYGKQPIILVNPTRPSTETESFQFAGWDSEITPATSDKVYKATYKSKDRIYNVKFVDGNNVISNLNYKYDEIINKPNDPVKAKDERYTYEFLGWYDKDDNKVDDFSNVKSNITYYAKYKEIANKYTITFKNPDGTILKTSELEYGVMPTYEGTPAKDGDAQYTYSFAKWDKEITSVTKDEVYTAEYQANDRIYNVKFVDGDNVISNLNYKYDEIINKPNDPVKESTKQYTYEFIGWFDKDDNKIEDFGNAKEDICYYSKYKETVNKYNITFKNADGSILKTEELEYGVMPEFDGTPTISNTAKYSYKFEKWDKEISTVKGDETYIAVYESSINKYTYKFYGLDNTIVSSNTILFGTAYSAPNIEDIVYSYSTFVFDGWYTEQTNGTIVTSFPPIENDVNYYAHFIENKNKYTITFDTKGGSSIDSITAEWGTIITKPNNPTKEGYDFIGWDTTIPETMPKSNLTATAKWQIKENSVYVTISDTKLASANIASGTKFKYGEKVHFEVTIASGYGCTVTMDKVAVSDKFDFSMPDKNVNIEVKVNVYSRNGNTITMGSYPQSLVKDEKLIPELLKISGGTSSSGWNEYDVYDGTGHGYYMFYKDIEYMENKYRAVYFTKFRPDYGVEAKEENSYVDDNGYKINEIYFFKYEPITWTIISEANGKAKCVSNLVLDSQAYTNSLDQNKYLHNAVGNKYTSYANNYFYSDVRIWLNTNVQTIGYTSNNSHSFMNTAFNKTQLAKLAKLGRSNIESVDDYVGLINTSDVPTNLQGYGTDYAMIQGLEVDSNKKCAYYTGSASGNGLDVLIVNSNGEYSGTAQCNYTHIGIRPVINIIL